MVETLLALPILLIVGLGALQFGLILQARHALNFALIEAARAGSVDHADPISIRSGLARGLLPWLYGASDSAEYARNLLRADVHLLEGEATGWVMLDQVSPTPESFDDWAQPARNANGDVIDGLREIPHDNLLTRSTRTQPASGVAAMRGQEPIGQISGQTLTDANLLRLRLDYGVPLVVPVVGRLMAWTLRVWDGCEPGSSNPASSSSPDRPSTRMGALRLPLTSEGVVGRLWPCVMYGQESASAGSSGTPRIPVRVLATVRMQSSARQSGLGASQSMAFSPSSSSASSLGWYAPYSTTAAAASDPGNATSDEPLAHAPSPSEAAGGSISPAPSSALGTPLPAPTTGQGSLFQDAAAVNDPAVCTSPNG
jgi:hypothetical protein